MIVGNQKLLTMMNEDKESSEMPVSEHNPSEYWNG
jgi:hypothetical protein